LALDEPELSPRELATRFTDTESYFVSEASVYRLLKAHDLIASPAFIVVKAADVNGTLNLTRASRYRHFEPDPSASSPLCPLAGTIGSQTLSSFISLLLAGRAMMPARRLSLSR
jgi:hypothetical protein